MISFDVHKFLCATFSSSSGDIPQTYDNIFNADVWTYDNLFPVKRVARKFLPETDMEKYIDQYNINFAEFRSITKIINFDDKCGDLSSKVLNHSREALVYYDQSTWQMMEIKLYMGNEASTLYLSLIDELSLQLSQQFTLSDVNKLVFKKFIKTELFLDWRVSSSEANTLDQLALESLDFLCSKSITFIVHKDFVIFDRSVVSIILLFISNVCKMQD